MAATKDNGEGGGGQEQAAKVVSEFVNADVRRSLGTDAAQRWSGLLRDGAAHEVLVSTLDALVVIDSRGSVVEWNPSATETFGYSRDEAVGVTIAELIIPDELRGAHRAAEGDPVVGPVVMRLGVGVRSSTWWRTRLG